MPNPIGRQIVLPTSKAVEIAWKSIHMRLSRSLLVTSGIVLALAFLMSILTQEALVGSMRNWSRAVVDSPQFAQWRKDEADLEGRLKTLSAPIAAELGKGVAASKKTFDVKNAFGKDWPELEQELGSLPGSAVELNALLIAKPDLVPKLAQWIDARRQIKHITATLNGPQNLISLLRLHGQSVTDAEIASGKIQTRWLLGLALLVAFVGILNAMLMSVTERFREIGTMKCLGALDSFIIKLFVIESLFQGLVGTFFGVAIGLMLSLASTWMAYPDSLWKNPPWTQILGDAGICLAVGVGLTVAGAVYPAWQAARMQPIDAMRAEA